MKKKIAVIALAAFATLGAAAYLHAHSVTNAGLADEIRCHLGMRCTFCNGTGFQGNFNCFHCKGTGRNNGY